MQEQKEKSALLIIDVQNDFCEGGSLAVNEASQTIPVINELRKNPKFDYIVLSKDWHPANHISFASQHTDAQPFTITTLASGKVQELWPDHCIAEKNGSEFHKDLVVDLQNDLIVKKGIYAEHDCYSAFGTEAEDTGMLGLLRQRDVKKVFVTGLAYDFCAGSTALDSAKAGFDTYIINESTRSVAPNFAAEMDAKIEKFSNIKKISVAEIDKYL